jgi:hypothetical protein
MTPLAARTAAAFALTAALGAVALPTATAANCATCIVRAPSAANGWGADSTTAAAPNNWGSDWPTGFAAA